ncbi:hypothetical protein [Desulfosarcina ovata]|uniref:hypothetical protein n=1 Tax=Desulfosarcina ovata TaxID=83564 RepID=UPI0012D35794|nr:hypothetical protein [Desulfosarcina ovata]
MKVRVSIHPRTNGCIAAVVETGLLRLPNNGRTAFTSRRLRKLRILGVFRRRRAHHLADLGPQRLMRNAVRDATLSEALLPKRSRWGVAVGQTVARIHRPGRFTRCDGHPGRGNRDPRRAV